MTDISDWLNAAEKLAPEPDQRASRPDWARHYAALALAAHAAFRDQLIDLPPNPEPGSRPELGYLSAIATSSTAAAIALTIRPEDVARTLWSLTPELGALNGEYIDWLAVTLAGLGINPAQLYPWFDANDFQVTPRPPKAVAPCDRCTEGAHCQQCGCCEF